VLEVFQSNKEFNIGVNAKIKIEPASLREVTLEERQ
jgi:hypothetical protein